MRHAQEMEDPFEIVIIDMQMPEMDGEELGRSIKQDPDLTDTILIMVSSMGARGDVARLRKIGFAAYLTKPIKQSQLYDCLATTAKIWKEKKQSQDATIVTRHSLADSKKRGIRILLAEDDATNQKVALHILKKFGYRADAAGNGQEVLEALEKEPYDIVLMDIQMPVMDGYEATRRIRELELKAQQVKFNETNSEDLSGSEIRFSKRSGRIPIVAMTAHAMKGDREKCIAAGMDDYTTKPINPEELLEKIEKWTHVEKNASNAEAEIQKEPVPSEISEDSQPLDFEKALERAMGDKDFLKMLLGGFIQELPDQIESLKVAVACADTVALMEQAHKLKGAAANLSAYGVSSAAKSLEEIGRSQNMDEANQILEVLLNESKRLTEYIERAEL
jgi:CheY-like chemotaxis protein